MIHIYDSFTPSSPAWYGIPLPCGLGGRWCGCVLVPVQGTGTSPVGWGGYHLGGGVDRWHATRINIYILLLTYYMSYMIHYILHNIISCRLIILYYVTIVLYYITSHHFTSYVYHIILYQIASYHIRIILYCMSNCIILYYISNCIILYQLYHIILYYVILYYINIYIYMLLIYCIKLYCIITYNPKKNIERLGFLAKRRVENNKAKEQICTTSKQQLG